MSKLIELTAEQILAMKSASLMSPETTALQCHFLKSPKPGKSWAQAISSKTQEKWIVNMADCLEAANLAAATGKVIPGFIKEDGKFSLTRDFEFDILAGVIRPKGKVEQQAPESTEQAPPASSSKSKKKKEEA